MVERRAEPVTRCIAGTPFMPRTSQAPETARKAPLYCTGCGSDISNQATDRRSLLSEQSKAQLLVQQKHHESLHDFNCSGFKVEIAQIPCCTCSRFSHWARFKATSFLVRSHAGHLHTGSRYFLIDANWPFYNLIGSRPDPRTRALGLASPD